ncbi:uncharacterized protein LOC115746988 [Rhodamnia argentea]|uniref:Uncharacterized protein LOC115746988 n=1 Tax=Rhodamnia argentea TaxID=178133 RepID=A0A8B8PVP4_9MYRT|nr:uncharacterized protein LOC115746988 [Rhodamnia argentea]
MKRRNSLPFHDLGTPKGWTSERVPSGAAAAAAARAHVNPASSPSFSPFNSNRTLPSKWEDAERWICSPVSANISHLPTHPNVHQRRPKSKSGPLGQSGYYPCYSPGVVDGWSGRSFVVGSPFSTGVMVADEGVMGCVGLGRGGVLSEKGNDDGNVGRSASGLGWSEMVDEKFDCTENNGNGVSPAVSRRDMATQMSPKSSPSSSPKIRPSNCQSPPSQSLRSEKLEVRDVGIDKQATMISWSRRHAARLSRKGGQGVEDSNRFGKGEAQGSSWDTVETTKNMSWLQREEAKITAWENLQKAKAEAAIKKLEMKLERKRSTGMDRILNKLRTAEVRAQEMRSSISLRHQDSKASQKNILFRRPFWVNSFRNCLHCHEL